MLGFRRSPSLSTPSLRFFFLASLCLFLRLLFRLISRLISRVFRRLFFRLHAASNESSKHSRYIIFREISWSHEHSLTRMLILWVIRKDDHHLRTRRILHERRMPPCHGVSTIGRNAGLHGVDLGGRDARLPEIAMG